MNKALIVIYTILITFLCVLGARKALSDEAFIFRGGPSIADGKPSGASKVFGLRHEEHQIRGIYSAMEFGGYVDNNGNGRKGAALAKLQLGVKSGPNTGLYGIAFTGPCVISSKDTQLGGFFQFCSDFGFGIRDRETLVNIVYSHISNAGLTDINRGRDFIVFGVGLAL